MEEELVSLRQGRLIAVFGNESEFSHYGCFERTSFMSRGNSTAVKNSVLRAHKARFPFQLGAWPAAGPWVNSVSLFVG